MKNNTSVNYSNLFKSTNVLTDEEEELLPAQKPAPWLNASAINNVSTGFSSKLNNKISFTLPTKFPPVSYEEFFKLLETKLNIILKLDPVQFWSFFLDFEKNNFKEFLFNYIKRDINVLDHLVFRILVRIFEAEKEDNCKGLPAAFGNKNFKATWLTNIDEFLHLNFLIEFTKIYSNANIEVVCSILKNLFGLKPSILEEELSALIRKFNYLIQYLAKKQLKKFTEENGKGKGKGKSSESCSQKVLSEAEEVELKSQIELIIDAVYTLVSFFNSCPKEALIILSSTEREFFNALFQVFDISNFLRNLHDKNLIVNLMDYVLLKIKVLKLLVVEVFKIFVFKGFLDDFMNSENFDNFDTFFMLMHRILEHSEVESGEASKILWDSPLAVDFDIKYDLLSQLNELLAKVKGHLDVEETRVQFLILSIENLLEISGNSNVKFLKTKKNRNLVAVENWNNELPPQYVQNDVARFNSVNQNNTNPNDQFIHRTSLISQVQDIFPELGEGFIDCCLKEFDDKPEIVIDKILMDDLPMGLKNLDRNTQREINNVIYPPSENNQIILYEEKEVQKQEDYISTRKNIFDGDEFDVFNPKGKIDATKVIFGKKSGAVAEKDEDFIKQVKPTILEYSIENDDVYDDEYDDTYDSNDIEFSGPVSTALTPDEDEIKKFSNTEKTLDPTLVFEPELLDFKESFFEKNQRNSKERKLFKEKSGLTDEQIEGWFKMFQRNPKKEKILSKYEFRGNKYNLPVEEKLDEPESNEDTQNQQKEKNPLQNHNRPNSTTSTATSDKNKNYKSKNKAKIGNHNRKKGHDKKLMKGFGGIPGTD
ncbi:hypothetical protein HDU92_004138 [Lobulomyces angularis]|nr:hypothetical protein HDU92_004138 [Lobulomyces angularis]